MCVLCQEDIFQPNTDPNNFVSGIFNRNPRPDVMENVPKQLFSSGGGGESGAVCMKILTSNARIRFCMC